MTNFAHTEFATAARTLRTVLTEENAALRRADPVATQALLAPKTAAAIALEAAASTAPRTYYTQALAEQIQQLAAENAALLQDAIAVQTRIVTLVTRAARATARATERTGYDHHGGDTAQAGAVAVMHQA